MCLFVGCGNSNTEQDGNEIQDGIHFAEYSGYWSCEGKTHEQILVEGGIGLSYTITEDDQFLGTFFSQQEITERFAIIEDISGKIEQAELYFDHTDDEWGNSGTLHIQFLSDSIYVEVLNDKNAAQNSDYGISCAFELIREKEDIAENGIAVDLGYHLSWTEEEMISAVGERSQYYKASAYYSEIIDYWENVREVRDISNVVKPLFETDRKYYTKEEFESEPMLVIHLAKMKYMQGIHFPHYLPYTHMGQDGERFPMLYCLWHFLRLGCWWQKSMCCQRFQVSYKRNILRNQLMLPPNFYIEDRSNVNSNRVSFLIFKMLLSP